MGKSFKVETLEEYLARGGKITKCPEGESVKKEQRTQPLSGGPATILTYEEADLFYGEARAKKVSTTVKSKVKVDIDMLPEALRKKFLAKATEETAENESEE